MPKFNKNLIKSYDEDSDIGYILEVDVEYPKSLYHSHNNIPFLPERMKIKKSHNLLCNLNDKKTLNFKANIKSLIDTKESA